MADQPTPTVSLAERKRQPEATLAGIRAEIDAGLASLDRGEGRDGEEVFRKLEAKAAARRGVAIEGD